MIVCPRCLISLNLYGYGMMCPLCYFPYRGEKDKPIIAEDQTDERSLMVVRLPYRNEKLSSLT